MNTLAQDPDFQQTRLYAAFVRQPVGVIDVGSLGGIHTLVYPIARLTHVLCFEPQEQACKALRALYSADHPFGKVIVEQTAVGGRNARAQKLYVTRSAVCSSLLSPGRQMTARYGAQGFRVDSVASVGIRTLDRIAFAKKFSSERLGEILKLDTQGNEYQVLKAARRLLDERCMALWCEAEFFEMYENQKTFADIAALLRDRGFVLYGLYPRYISTKRLRPPTHQTQERVVDADCLFFKDPLDPCNARRRFSQRQIQVLVLAAIVLRYYDFALELTERLDEPDPALKRLIGTLAHHDTKSFLRDFDRLLPQRNGSQEKTYLRLRQFMDTHRFNSSVEYMTKAGKE